MVIERSGIADLRCENGLIRHAPRRDLQRNAVAVCTETPRGRQGQKFDDLERIHDFK
jgi:hypothetical protein